MCLAIKTATTPITAARIATPTNAPKNRGITVAPRVGLIAPVYNSFPGHEARMDCEPAVPVVQVYSKCPSGCVNVVPMMVQGELLTLV